jgi:hypothetical protein
VTIVAGNNGYTYITQPHRIINIKTPMISNALSKGFKGSLSIGRAI